VGYSGVIYAAIVAAWAAVLVPRWVRRNEEVDEAREIDGARGVRILARPADVSRAGRHGHGAGVTATATFHDGRVAGTRVADPADHSRVEPNSRLAEKVTPSSPHGQAEFGVAARRRRRVLLILLLAVAATAAAVVVVRMPAWWVVVPSTSLAGFLVLARRAAVREARRRRFRRRPAAGPAAPVAHEPVPTRIAVLDEPEPVPEVDPDAWEPVAVPLPTYVTKAVAPPQATRKIDLTQPGAWTSGRLDPAGSITLPKAATAPERRADEAEELPEQRRAVGD
jgi:hypothetical protein